MAEDGERNGARGSQSHDRPRTCESASDRNPDAGARTRDRERGRPYVPPIAGARIAGYAISWLTGRFEPPFDRLQLNLAGKFLDVADAEEAPRADCVCRRVRGWADQASADTMITAPAHWPAPRLL